MEIAKWCLPSMLLSMLTKAPRCIWNLLFFHLEVKQETAEQHQAPLFLIPRTWHPIYSYSTLWTHHEKYPEPCICDSTADVRSFEKCCCKKMLERMYSDIYVHRINIRKGKTFFSLILSREIWVVGGKDLRKLSVSWLGFHEVGPLVPATLIWLQGENPPLSYSASWVQNCDCYYLALMRWAD